MLKESALDWSAIDTVLLDMDGTLLDLRFDNWFWRELIPRRYAAANGLELAAAQALLAPKFRGVMGSLQWYCIDHWTRELSLDIAAYKRAALARINFLPGAEEFLVKLRGSGKRRALVTNAHPTALAIKSARVALKQYFDACYSSHAFEAPKEDAAFWPRFAAAEGFTPARTLLVDDNLAVLKAAREFGIGWLCAVRRPDSERPAQATGDFAAVDRVADLLA
ncbi:MAG: GMP/IMP nucleotidase [Pseudomonadota bacterium]|nr:GMP/IMP nucleotidase [Pseudomonadota bacterium]